ncbi:MAG: hypothetical protein WBQ60_06755 [Asticcacaulis sp.]
MKRFVLLPLLALLIVMAACSPKTSKAPEPASVAAPAPVADHWPGSYEGDILVRIKGTAGAHRVVLVEAEADGCSGDVGLAGGEPAQDISPTELRLVLKPDETATCTLTLKKDGEQLTISESGICTTYHGLACSFNGTAQRVK